MADNDFIFLNTEQSTPGGDYVGVNLSLPTTDYIPPPPPTTSDEE